MSIIDEHCKYGGTILTENGVTYSCMLNQTEIDSNKNKFYIMQIINTGTNYVWFIRYGRIGEPGKSSYSISPNTWEAVNDFEKQFRTKTGNKFNTPNFVKKNKKYFLTKVSYEEELKTIDKDELDKKELVSNLDKKIQELISLFSNEEMMTQTLISLNIDTKKMPLGKLSKTQLENANDVLTQIQTELKGTQNEETIKQLSSAYYTLVPVACGRRKPPVIDNDLIDKYFDTIENLKNMVITVNLVKNTSKTIHKLDDVYDKLKTDITHVDNTSNIYSEINKYVINSHGSTHHFKMNLQDLYKVNRHGNEEQFNKYTKNIDNRELLIHGSRVCNWVSILQNNLLLDPSKLGVVIVGKMFGYGVYFANSFSKSANYCGLNKGSNTVCFALAEVVLGKESKRTKSDYYITKESLKKEGCDSTWGLGKMTPESFVMVDGVKIPNGKLVPSNVSTVLQYDEKMMYDSNQFCIRYLAIVNVIVS
jgi:poly [ADP-ribose] polymerase